VETVEITTPPENVLTRLIGRIATPIEAAMEEENDEEHLCSN
jgi:hypothetical protein